MYALSQYCINKNNHCVHIIQTTCIKQKFQFFSISCLRYSIYKCIASASMLQKRLVILQPAESLIKPKTFYKYSFVTATRFYCGGKIPLIDYRVLYEQERKRYEQERERNSKLEKELGIRETQLIEERKKNDRILIPLANRHYATVIEAECPIVQPIQPQPIQSSITKIMRVTKDFSKEDVNRALRFIEIFHQYGHINMYVEAVNNALQDFFMAKHGIPEISGTWKAEYEICEAKFCKSIVLSINHANKLVAHMETCGVARDALSVYAKPIDINMTIFYNALMGHESK